MSDIAIRVENLGKKYLIRHQQQGRRYNSLRDTLAARFRNPFRKRNSASSAIPALAESWKSTEEFWALKDVSFEIKRGEAVGIIGRNGAGKSTLLKLLSRITQPTTGRIELDGRVASLLEVGTGFHPELTGRENIYLNGAILGMGRMEIRRKFDEIVAFAEVEKFLDTPVKRYSSGMYVRLAFAVAAHLDPEILIVDEVLAVGDAQFQKKCLGKMDQVANDRGRTVIFVSHNMQAIRQLCSHALVLSKSALSFSGSVHEGIVSYLQQGLNSHDYGIDLSNYPRNSQLDGARLTRVEFLNEDNQPVRQLSRNTDLNVRVNFWIEKPLTGVDIPMALVHVEGTRVFSESYSDHRNPVALDVGAHTVSFTLPLKFLKLESYFLVIGIYANDRHCDLVEGLPLPELIDPKGNSFLEAKRWGVVRVPVSWTKIEHYSEGTPK